MRKTKVKEKDEGTGKPAVKPVSFTANEQDILKHAEKQGGFSYYVKRLIREDMEKGRAGTLAGVDVSNLLALLKNGELNVNNQNISDSQEELLEQKPKLSKNAIASIMNIAD